MCDKCGCSDQHAQRTPAHAGVPVHAHAHQHQADEPTTLAHHDRLAERNRGFFRAKRVFVVNLLSFTGSAGHAFIARTITEYPGRIRVITPAFLEQVQARHQHHDHPSHPAADTTDDNLALDAHMLAHALDHLDLDQVDVVLLENHGSAASQAVYDLGETRRVALFSVRDGAHKPLKFPLFFAQASAVVINELEQATAAGFDLPLARTHLAQVAPTATIIEVSPATGAGMAGWYAFLDQGIKQAHA
jgi:hydrogenase nickel incorporation protein HypB